jgi:hypothetical protein
MRNLLSEFTVRAQLKLERARTLLFPLPLYLRTHESQIIMRRAQANQN